MKKRWFLLACPLFLLCLAFDPAGDRTASFRKEPDRVDLLALEKSLVSARRQSDDGDQGIGPVSDRFGADPYRIRYLRQSDRFLILLRAASAVVLCDGNLEIIDRVDTVRQPVAMDLVDNDILLVGGECSNTINRYRIGLDRIDKLPGLDLRPVVSVRDLVYVSDADGLFLIDAFSRRLIQATISEAALRQPAPRLEIRSFPIGAGPLRLLSVKDHLIVNLMLEHTLQIIPLRRGAPDFSQAAKISNDGPFWAVDARACGRSLVIAAGGVENRPLSRESGEFGYLDSFVYFFTLAQDQTGTYRWNESDRTDARRYRSINLSKRHVLTPKSITLTDVGPDQATAWISGYGADRFLSVDIGANGVVAEREIGVMPGVTDFVITPPESESSLVCVSPLLDRAVKRDLNTGKLSASLAFEPTARSGSRFTPRHLGELLFYTDLMSPDNSSAGELSRFTCEACHFEGRIDGRVHYTGRGDIHATTRPLFGLANNVPLFSRAGDASLSSMVMAEFIVANQQRRAFFTLRKTDYPWMAAVEEMPDELTPTDQREGLLAFFMAFAPPPNPWRTKQSGLNRSARLGMAVFRDRCADCHQPLLSTRTGAGVKYDAWAHWLSGEDLDLVWGAPFLSRTGVTPYVDPAGARVPSLRRIWMKYPLFTNGSAKTLRDLLNDFRYRGALTYHSVDGQDRSVQSGLKSLTPKQIDDLEMLLRYF